MDFINATRILRSKDIIGICSHFVEQDDTAMLNDSFIQSLRSNPSITVHLFKNLILHLSWKTLIMYLVHAVVSIPNILIRTINTSQQVILD